MSIKMFQNGYRFSSNTYVLNNNLLVIVIDPGFYNGEFKEYLKELGHVDVIFLTHGHFDHIGGVDELKQDYPNAIVYIHKEDYNFLTNPLLNYSISMGFELVIESKVEKIKESTLSIGDYEIEVIHTPGHTKGSILLYFKNENILFTGDTIIGNSIGATHLPTGSAKEMNNSIKTFINLKCQDEMSVYSGHGDIMTYNDILKNNEYIKNYFKNLKERNYKL